MRATYLQIIFYHLPLFVELVLVELLRGDGGVRVSLVPVDPVSCDQGVHLGRHEAAHHPGPDGAHRRGLAHTKLRYVPPRGWPDGTLKDVIRSVWLLGCVNPAS